MLKISLSPGHRRENEFKKPVHAPQNGRVHHRPYPSYNKASTCNENYVL